jgi:hypothetical protein
MRESMDKNRIVRREHGTSGRLTAKSISIKHAERRSGDGAQKAAELTPGDLPCCRVSDWGLPRGDLSTG